MTGKMIWGIALGLLGAMISVVPNFLLKTCGHCMSEGMNCPIAAKAEFMIGIMILLMAVFFIASESKETRMGISIGTAMMGMLSALMATFIIGFCDGNCSPECACSALRTPVITIMGALVALISLANICFISCWKKAWHQPTNTKMQ